MSAKLQLKEFYNDLVVPTDKNDLAGGEDNKETSSIVEVVESPDALPQAN